jgi:mRNA interferase RelE/StbE
VAYRVELEGRAKREFLRLPSGVQDRIRQAIDGLVQEPRPAGAKRLVGHKGFRIRRGDYRILYTVDDPARLVRVYRIGHRRDIYRRL